MMLIFSLHKSLSSQYKADLQRLDFISKGEKAVKRLAKNDTCPFCGGSVDTHDESYNVAIQAETKRIVFLNSVIALMLYEYFNLDDVFIKPDILKIDTPLLGFDENEDGIQGAMLKNGLYQYFINHKGNGQIIIIDNLNVMPDIDLQAAGAKVTTYHKDEKDGHVYGFMPSWRKDLPKETE